MLRTVRRDLKRVCDGCPIRTHLAECPSCERATVPVRGGPRPTRLSRALYALALLVLLVEIGGWTAAGAVAIWMPWWPNALLLLLWAFGWLVFLATALVWAFVASLGSGVVEGLRSSPLGVAFGPVPWRRGLVDALFDGAGRMAKRAHDAMVGPGYAFSALFVFFGFIAAVFIDLATELGTDFRNQLFGTALLAAAAAMLVPNLVRLSVGLLRPEPLPGDPSGSGPAALSAALRGRTEVEGVVSADGPSLTSPAGDEVVAFRLVGEVDGHAVDDADAVAFRLTDDTERVGRVEADGPVLVALEAGGERVAASSLDPAFLAERGLSGSGTLTLYRLRHGDRVRVSADFARGSGGRAGGYREAVAMTLSPGDEPLVLRDPG